jgi:hypothetical protein
MKAAVSLLIFFSLYSSALLSQDKNIQAKASNTSGQVKGRETPIQIDDVKTLNSALEKIQQGREFPHLKSFNEFNFESSYTFPKWVSSIFSTIHGTVFSDGAEVLHLVACKGCTGGADIEQKMIGLDPSFIIYLDENYNEQEKEDCIKGLVAHEIGHYLISLYSHLYSTNHLSPLGFYEMADMRYIKPSSHNHIRHAEVDLMGYIILMKIEPQDPLILIRSLRVINEYIRFKSGEYSESIDSRIKTLSSLLN